MARCKDIDQHDWRPLTQVQGTGLLEVIYTCSCGVYKKVQHVDLAEYNHPDARVKRMKARAEAAQENEDEE